jgi:hypothetical protein
MRIYCFIVVLFVLVLVSITSCNQQETDSRQISIFRSLSGPYLGQEPPGKTPELFAPGIVSTGHNEMKAVFSPDGRELLYQLWGAPYPVILRTIELERHWTEPVNLGEEVNTVGGVALTLTSDGKYLLFTGKGNEPNSDIYWVSTKIIEEKKLMKTIGGDGHEKYHCLYFGVYLNLIHILVYIGRTDH